MKNVFSVSRARGIALKASVALLAVSSSGAFAAGTVPTWATTIATDATDQATALAGTFGLAVGVVIGIEVVFRLIKRFSRKI